MAERWQALERTWFSGVQVAHQLGLQLRVPYHRVWTFGLDLVPDPPGPTRFPWCARVNCPIVRRSAIVCMLSPFYHESSPASDPFKSWSPAVRYIWEQPAGSLVPYYADWVLLLSEKQICCSEWDKSPGTISAGELVPQVPRLAHRALVHHKFELPNGWNDEHPLAWSVLSPVHLLPTMSHDPELPRTSRGGHRTAYGSWLPALQPFPYRSVGGEVARPACRARPGKHHRDGDLKSQH